jgi:hypothetical protein
MSQLDVENSVRDRLRIIYEMVGATTDAEFERKTGIKSSTMSACRNRNSMGGKIAKLIADLLGLRQTWVRFGYGPMFRVERDMTDINEEMKAQQAEIAQEDELEQNLVFPAPAHDEWTSLDYVRGRIIHILSRYKCEADRHGADVLGIPYGTLLSIIVKDCIRPATAQIIAEKTGRIQYWIMTGGGPELDQHKKTQKGENYLAVNKAEPTKQGLKVVDAQGVADALVNIAILRRFGDGEMVEIVIRGDSMAPTLNDGEKVVVDRSKTDVSDGVFALHAGQSIIVRRFQYRPDGSLEVIRDNPRYEKEVLSTDEISGLEVLGKVVYRYGNVY